MALVGPTGPVGPTAALNVTVYADGPGAAGWQPATPGGLVHDPATHKLGKRPASHDPRSLRLARYLAQSFTFPPAVDWSTRVTNWLMLANDRLGDCVIAMAGHLIMLWTAWAGDPVAPTDDQIITAYSAITGYNPADPSTDRGTDENQMMAYWRSTGIAGHKITAWADVDPSNTDEVRYAIATFGGIASGIALPVTAQSQAVWDVVGDGKTADSAPGSWGGHGVPLVGYNAVGPLCITWGAVKQMTWAFLVAYCDELHAPVSADFLNTSGVDPSGLNLTALLADLQAIPPLPEVA